MKAFIVHSAVAVGVLIALPSCTNPYAPGEHANGGGCLVPALPQAVPPLAAVARRSVEPSDRRAG
jgi:hypothetical protein